VEGGVQNAFVSKVDLYGTQDGFDCVSSVLRLAQEIRQSEGCKDGRYGDEFHDLAVAHRIPHSHWHGSLGAIAAKTLLNRVILRAGSHLLNDISQDPRFRLPQRLDTKANFLKRSESTAAMQSRSGPWKNPGGPDLKPFAIQAPKAANVMLRLDSHPNFVHHPLLHVGGTMGAQMLQIGIMLDKPPSNSDCIVSIGDRRFVAHAVILAADSGGRHAGPACAMGGSNSRP
jgi:hypothetical protein